MTEAAEARRGRVGSGVSAALALTLFALFSTLFEPTVEAQGRFNGWPGSRFSLRPVDPIRQINQHRGHLGWGNVWVGMTHRQVSKAMGQRLPIPAEIDNGFGCKRSIVETRSQRQDLILEFSDLGEVAPLRAIWVIVPQAERHPLDPTSIAKVLKKKIPDLHYVSSAGGRAVPEGVPRLPLYAASNGERLLIDPDSGVYLGELCLRPEAPRDHPGRSGTAQSAPSPPR